MKIYLRVVSEASFYSLFVNTIWRVLGTLGVTPIGYKANEKDMEMFEL